MNQIVQHVHSLIAASILEYQEWGRGAAVQLLRDVESVIARGAGKDFRLVKSALNHLALWDAFLWLRILGERVVRRGARGDRNHNKSENQSETFHVGAGI